MSTTNTNALKQNASGVADAALGVIEQAKDQFAQAEKSVREKAENAAITTERYVGGHPWTLLAVAGSVGVVIGLLLRR